MIRNDRKFLFGGYSFDQEMQFKKIRDELSKKRVDDERTTKR